MNQSPAPSFSSRSSAWLRWLALFLWLVCGLASHTSASFVGAPRIIATPPVPEAAEEWHLTLEIGNGLFCANDPVNRWDYLGMADDKEEKSLEEELAETFIPPRGHRAIGGGWFRSTLGVEYRPTAEGLQVVNSQTGEIETIYRVNNLERGPESFTFSNTQLESWEHRFGPFEMLSAPRPPPRSAEEAFARQIENENFKVAYYRRLEFLDALNKDPNSLLDAIIAEANMVASEGGQITARQANLLRQNLPIVQRRSVSQNRASREEFEESESYIIKQWEINTGQTWPERATPHHVIPLESGGANKWYNIMPTYGFLPTHSLPGIPGPHSAESILRQSIQQPRSTLVPGTTTDLRKPYSWIIQRP